MLLAFKQCKYLEYMPHNRPFSREGPGIPPVDLIFSLLPNGNQLPDSGPSHMALRQALYRPRSTFASPLQITHQSTGFDVRNFYSIRGNYNSLNLYRAYNVLKNKFKLFSGVNFALLYLGKIQILKSNNKAGGIYEEKITDVNFYYKPRDCHG